MTQKAFTLPELMLMAGTRVALGVGVGLLVAEKLDRDTRRGAGGALLIVGVLTTVPLLMGLIGKPRVADRDYPL